jgi:hypothetical protein
MAQTLIGLAVAVDDVVRQQTGVAAVDLAVAAQFATRRGPKSGIAFSGMAFGIVIFIADSGRDLVDIM